MTQLSNGKPYCIPLEGYRHMYRSMIRFCSMSKPEAMELIYPLYIGNLDTCQYEDVPLNFMELTPDGFRSLLTPFVRPYHTELQMHRSMLGLVRNIHREATIQNTRDAVRYYLSLVDALEHRFEDTYDCEINDPRTQYSRCWSRLTVRDNEPLTIFKPVCSYKREKTE